MHDPFAQHPRFLNPLMARSTSVQFAAIILVAILSISATMLTLRQYTDTSEWVGHTYQVIEQSSNLESAIAIVEASQRTYLLTGDEADLTPYWATRDDIEQQAERLRQLVVDNPAQVARLQRLKPLLSGRIQALEDARFVRERGTLEDSAKAVTQSKGRQLSIDAKTIIREIIDEENRLLAVRSYQASRSFRGFIWFVSVGSLLEVVLVLYAARTISNETRLRTEAEQTMMQERETLDAFVRYSPVAIAMFDVNMNFVAVSDEWTRRFQYEREEVIGRCGYVIMPWLPSEWRLDHRRAIEAGQRVEVRDAEMRRRDGKMEFLHRVLVPWVIKGQVGGVIIFYHFVTDEVNYRTELRRVQAIVSELELEKAKLLGTIRQAAENRSSAAATS